MITKMTTVGKNEERNRKNLHIMMQTLEYKRPIMIRKKRMKPTLGNQNTRLYSGKKTQRIRLNCVPHKHSIAKTMLYIL
jgi:hypothetical protein